MHCVGLIGLLSLLALAAPGCRGDGAASEATSSETGSESDGGSDTGGPECEPGQVGGDDGACHCGDAAGPICGEGAFCDAGASTCVDPVCNPGVAWAPGTKIFAEVTQEWGLAGVEGVRVNVTDVDGDGWADLFVRRGGVQSDDFAAGTRHTWLLRNDEGAGFSDVTQASGVLATRQGLGPDVGRPAEVIASADVDNDGDLDLFTGTSTEDAIASLGETSELMLNQGDGTFALGPAESALRMEGSTDLAAGAAFVDVNRDGNIDLWVTQHGQQDRLYYGDGTGNFVDATAGSGLVTEATASYDVLNAAGAHSRAWSAAACDLDGDGWTELLAASYGRAPNHLWQGHLDQDSGFVMFDRRSVESLYAYDESLEWKDNQFARCYCQGNPDAEDCADVPAPQIQCSPNWNHANDRQPYRLGGNSGATACADIDNDGDIDLYTGEIRHWWAGDGSDHSELLVNTGEAKVRFERPGRAALGIEVPHVTGTSWDEGHMSLTTLDFDNDGWRDVYVGASDYPGNRGLLYHQGGPLAFELVSIEDAFEHNRSHGVAAADFDRDGDLDLVVGHSRARCDANAPNDCYATPQVRMFENVLGDGGNWIALRLHGAQANAAAIGARVQVRAGETTQTQEIGGGYGHYGAQDDLVLHFGLGEACEAEIEIRWPDTQLSTQSFTLPAGHRFAVTQGTAPVLDAD